MPSNGLGGDGWSGYSPGGASDLRREVHSTRTPPTLYDFVPRDEIGGVLARLAPHQASVFPDARLRWFFGISGVSDQLPNPRVPYSGDPQELATSLGIEQKWLTEALQGDPVGAPSPHG